MRVCLHIGIDKLINLEIGKGPKAARLQARVRIYRAVDKCSAVCWVLGSAQKNHKQEHRQQARKESIVFWGAPTWPERRVEKYLQ